MIMLGSYTNLSKQDNQEDYFCYRSINLEK